MKEWLIPNGFGFYASSGWAQFDRHFVVWAEHEGCEFDTITQSDLYHPEILAHYACAIIVGHDEYWTSEMRHAIEAFVEQGGRWRARGNASHRF